MAHLTGFLCAGVTLTAAALAGHGATMHGTTTVPDALAAPAAAPAPGLPFGLFEGKTKALGDPYTSAMQTVQPDGVLRDLAAARAHGARVILNLAGGAAKYTDGDGHFDLERWKARIDRYLPIADRLNGYVADSTLLAIMLVDEPFALKRWAGKPVPMATLDEMARYSKSLFPGLPTAIRQEPSRLRGYAWQHLDTGWAQYTARKAGTADFIAKEAGAARTLGLGLIVGLNITKGGDGSSGFGHGDEWSMTGDEILRNGRILLGEPYACAFISWDGRPNVVGRPDVAAALRELAMAARAKTAVSCMQRGANPGSAVRSK